MKRLTLIVLVISTLALGSLKEKELALKLNYANYCVYGQPIQMIQDQMADNMAAIQAAGGTNVTGSIYYSWYCGTVCGGYHACYHIFWYDNLPED